MIAFPGAQGYGAETVHGSGRHLAPCWTTVYRVTNLNASGPGSFREALEASGPRVQIFEVSGTIDIGSHINIYNPYLYIAGQTAPPPGITIKSCWPRVRTHDVLIQHLRFRLGDEEEGRLDDCLSILDGAYNVMVDHCSFSWGVDGNLDISQVGTRNITVSNCIISEALENSVHPDGPHSTGMLLRREARYLTVHNNLFAHNDNRNPRVEDAAPVEIASNLIYGWGGSQGPQVDGHAGEDPLAVDWLSNYLKRSPDSNPVGILITDDYVSGSRVYVEGNIGPTRPHDTDPEWDIVSEGSASIWRSMVPVSDKLVSVMSAEAAYDSVLANAGARPVDRDAVDKRIINDVRNGTGGIIDSQDEVGGWPALAENHRALTVPDNPNADSGDGYTNLEKWLQEFAAEVEDGAILEPDYERTYVLLPPGAGRYWAHAVIDATWDTHRFTVGGSADDAMAADLAVERVIAVNPEGWPGDLEAYLEITDYVPVTADSPGELYDKLKEMTT